MEDYFALAGYNELAKREMARAKLEGGAKTWWKLSCQSRGVSEVTQSWEEIKERIRERYLPLNYSNFKINEFLSCVRKGREVKVYYEEFITLSRYSPGMTEEQRLSRFILGLEGSLAKEAEALQPSSLADALIRAISKHESMKLNTAVALSEKRRMVNQPSP